MAARPNRPLRRRNGSIDLTRTVYHSAQRRQPLGLSDYDIYGCELKIVNHVRVPFYTDKSNRVGIREQNVNPRILCV